jgi:hypothetical protein
MKYALVFIGVFADCTPKEQFLQNIQRMLYIRISGNTSLSDLQKELIAMCDCQEQIDAVMFWVEYQYQESPEVTQDTIVIHTEDECCVQFDLRPEGTY